MFAHCWQMNAAIALTSAIVFLGGYAFARWIER